MIAASDPRIAEALRRCRELTRREAKNFYYGLKLLPEPKRSALYAIYAWMRAADDLVDDPPGGSSRTADAPPSSAGVTTSPHDDAAGGADAAARKRRVESFRAATLAALESREPAKDSTLAALQFAARLYRIDPRHLHDMLDGQLEDLHPRRLRTFRELELYCRRVASSVGLICIEVWGYSDPRARDLAVDRGIAFQLTNILRDVREDFAGGRVYLPAEDLERHNLTIEKLLDPQTPRGEVLPFLNEQIERAQRYYDRSAPLIDLIAPDARPTLWAMTNIYHGLLEQMRDDPLRIVRGPRPKLSLIRKASIALRARTVSVSTDGRARNGASSDAQRNAGARA